MATRKKPTLGWADLNVAQVQRLAEWRDVAIVFTIVLVLWGLYRLLFRLPTNFEEVILKGFVFGLPVLVVARRYQWRLVDLGISSKRLTLSVYGGLALGIMLGVVGQLGNILRHQGLQWSQWGLTSETLGGFIVLSLVTAFWEQLLFCGLFLRMTQDILSDEWKQAWVVAILFVVLHVPALIFIQQFVGFDMVVALLLLLLLQLGNVILRLRFDNLIAPIMAQALWGVTVFLFR